MNHTIYIHKEFEERDHSGTLVNKLLKQHYEFQDLQKRAGSMNTVQTSATMMTLGGGTGDAINKKFIINEEDNDEAD